VRHLGQKDSDPGSAIHKSELQNMGIELGLVLERKQP
jgi:hypothetical protein